MGMTEIEKKKAAEMVKKAKDANYSADVIIMIGILAFSSDNVGHEIETLDKFIDLIDKYHDEREFFKHACLAVGIR